MDRLNKRRGKVHETVLGMGLMLRMTEGCLHNGNIPINEFYWEISTSRFRDDKSIDMDHFKYIHYEDISNLRIWAFKKQ